MAKKAYQIINDEEYLEDLESIIVFAENATQAKMQFCGEIDDLTFIDIRVRRANWADQYAEAGVIPIEAWLDNGYRVPCAECECMISEKEDCVIEDDRAYCLECYEYLRGENRAPENN